MREGETDEMNVIGKMKRLMNQEDPGQKRKVGVGRKGWEKSKEKREREL